MQLYLEFEDVARNESRPGKASNLPDGSLVAPEIRNPGLSSFFDLEYFDGPVRGAGGQPGAVVVHLGIVDHVLERQQMKRWDIDQLRRLLGNQTKPGTIISTKYV